VADGGEFSLENFWEGRVGRAAGATASPSGISLAPETVIRRWHNSEAGGLGGRRRLRACPTRPARPLDRYDRRDNGDHGDDPHFAASSSKVTAKPRPGNRSWHLLKLTTFRISAQAAAPDAAPLAYRPCIRRVLRRGATARTRPQRVHPAEQPDSPGRSQDSQSPGPPELTPMLGSRPG
jgi:hypothetical protein